MKERLRPGRAFQQGGNNARKVGNKGLIVLWPALGDTKKKKYQGWVMSFAQSESTGSYPPLMVR